MRFVSIMILNLIKMFIDCNYILNWVFGSLLVDCGFSRFFGKKQNEAGRESDYRAYWLARNQRILDWLLRERSTIICLQVGIAFPLHFHALYLACSIVCYSLCCVAICYWVLIHVFLMLCSGVLGRK